MPAESRVQRDIEETDDELEEEIGDPTDLFEKKQKELITNVVDYNLSTLASLIDDRTIDLSPKYQRRFRWNRTKQSRLIESFLMNVPVPQVFLSEDQYGTFSVIDGKQRLTAISLFMRGRLSLEGLEFFKEINGQTFDDLQSSLRAVLRTRPTLRATIILSQSDPDIKFEVFKRLNTGGVQLNPQEIRNATYTGPLNDLILDLSVGRRFHNLLGIRTAKEREKSVIYQDMRDAELVLRYMTFRDTWPTFSGSLIRSMDHFMYEYQVRPSYIGRPQDRLRQHT